MSADDRGLATATPSHEAPLSDTQRRVWANSRTVAHSALWNLLGRAAPILVAFAVTPYLIQALGPTRWGAFTIALSLIGIFGIFDFGLGRSLTRLIAARVSVGEEAEAASLVMTAMLVLTGLGLVSTTVMIMAAHEWVGGAVGISSSLHGEVLYAVYVFCASAPFVLVNAAMWGVLSAYQRFRAGNLVNIPITVMYYVGPLLALQVWDSLVGVMLVLVLCRIATTAACWRVCLSTMPLLRGARPSWSGLRPLARLSGWMTVSNLAWPILTSMDRFVVAGMLSAAAAGYYATPFDLVGRFSILTIAINTSVYPAMAASFLVDPGNTVTLFRRSMLAIVSLLFPACLIVVSFSDPLLTLWLGADFATHAAPVMRWAGIGIMVASVDGVVSCLIDGIGRPDVNAKISLLELAVSVPLLVLLLRSFGIEGAAIAWTLRCAVDLVIRLHVATRLYPAIAGPARALRPTMVAGIVLLPAPLLVHGASTRCLVIAAAVLAYLSVTLVWSCTRHERRQLWMRLRAIHGPRALAVASLP